MLETQVRNECKKITEIPTTQDNKDFGDFLNDKRSEAFKILQKDFDFQAWETLSKTTMISVQLFNLRRPGETERMLMENFTSRQTIGCKNNEELFRSLTKEAQASFNKYERIVIGSCMLERKR